MIFFQFNMSLIIIIHKGSMKRFSSQLITIKNFSYNPLDQIGKGFSSIVYKGINNQTKQNVAIKVIDMRTIRDSAAKDMLNWEIQALTTLSHQNIMKCYDVIKDNKNCYIITEFCNGGDLADHLKKHRTIRQFQLIPLLKDIVNGLVQIAENKFLHRDLKLANVLLHNKRAKIADFGFAKKYHQSKQKQRYNVGSPLYQSPQALQSNIYSVGNDIWALGIMCYEMLYGKTPWQCRTEAQLISKMTRVPVSFKKSIQVSDNLKKFIKKCLQVSESRRMTLKQLKEWNFSCTSPNPMKKMENKENMDGQNAFKLQKRVSMPQTRPRALSQITNKINNRENRKSLQKNKMVKKISDQPSKQIHTTTQKLTKSRIHSNNNRITKEILLFRLYFKTWEKLNQSDDDQSASPRKILGNEAVRLVTMLKKLVCSGNLDINKLYSLKCCEQYLNPIKNPSIKKFKQVIAEYFNRYTQKIKMEVITSCDGPSQVIKEYLRKNKNSKLLEKDTIVGHWLVNLMSASADNSKKSLQNALEPQKQINYQQIKQRIEVMCSA